MTERLEELIKWADEHMDDIPYQCGIFSTRGIDPSECIFATKDGIRVYACYGYCYVDVIGLTDAEFKEFCKHIWSYRDSDEDEEDEI